MSADEEPRDADADAVAEALTNAGGADAVAEALTNAGGADAVAEALTDSPVTEGD